MRLAPFKSKARAWMLFDSLRTGSGGGKWFLRDRVFHRNQVNAPLRTTVEVVADQDDQP